MNYLAVDIRPESQVVATKNWTGPFLMIELSISLANRFLTLSLMHVDVSERW